MEITKKTKYFGNVELNRSNDFQLPCFYATLNEQKVCFEIYGCNNDDDLAGILPFFWEIVDKYVEINNIAKEAINEYCDIDDDKKYNATIDGIWYIKDFFGDLFGNKTSKELNETLGVNNFKELDIKKAIKKLYNPDLAIFIDDEIEIWLYYRVSDLENWNERLIVIMDKDLNVIGFEEK